MSKLFQLIISVIIFGTLLFGLSACTQQGDEPIYADADLDGISDIDDTDDDNDGVDDNADAFPNDPTESADTDGDGVGDNADAFPNDATETVDSDGDGVGDSADAFPNDATRSYLFAYKLNDTGITWGGNYPTGNNTSCIGETITEQDCSHGRDVTFNDDTDGHAGFSFTKIDSNGNVLPASATSWDCVLDNVMGLMWEVKTNDGSLRDKDWTYSSYDSNTNTNGGFVGNSSYGVCIDSTNCDTEKYVTQVNAAGLCGYHDWRLPNLHTLHSIVNFDGSNPSIDNNWFPNTQSSYYWSATIHGANVEGAQLIYFLTGQDTIMSRGYAGYVRLVRSE